MALWVLNSIALQSARSEHATEFLRLTGSSVVPFRSMLRHHEASGSGSDVPARLLYSARTLGDVIYCDELMRLDMRDAIDVRVTLTREQPDGWKGYAGRIDRAMLEDVAWTPGDGALVYVCMSTHAGAHISTVKAGHLSLITRPDAVTQIILTAIDATT